MPTGIAPGEGALAIDAAVAKGTWIQLHVGDPGAAGTANPALNTTREQASFAAAAGNPATAVTDAVLEWTNVPEDEDYTHFTMWTAAAAGTFTWSGTITANPVQTADAFRFPVGQLSLSVTGAA